MSDPEDALAHRAVPYKAPWPVLAGIALLAAAALGQELVLTRLMSLTLYHHFAFLAVSLAMLGMGFGGVAVHAHPDLARSEGVNQRMAWAALGFSASILWGFVAQQSLSLSMGLSVGALLSTAGKTLALSTPFFFFGLAMAIALRHYAADTARVYGADLLGASLGCALAVVLLELLGGRGALMSLSVLGALAAWVLFTSDTSTTTARPIRRPIILVLPVIAASLAAGSLIELRPPNRKAGSEPLIERWNAYSRVGVYPILNTRKALGETLGKDYSGEFPAAKFIQIDSSAGSHILNFSRGDLNGLDYLRHDIAYTGFHLNDQKGKVLVIGPGGGRDVLAALQTGRNSITGVEVNPLIADLVRKEFGDFSGNLWQRPGLKLVVDEARSYLARSRERYDFIHASLACTWAATAGGAFVLSENSLYTVEAFHDYLEHLDEEGILSMTMWFRGRPGELLRLAELARQALHERGVAQPGQHIAVLSHSAGVNVASSLPTGFGTFLLKKSPFQASELSRLQELTRREGFNLLYAPGLPGDATFKTLLEGDAKFLTDTYPLDISAPTDDRPFFFYQLRPSDYVRTWFGDKQASAGSDPLHRSVAGILVGLLAVTTFWVFLLLVVPMAWKSAPFAGKGPRSLGILGYFGFIGLAFMLVEIPLLQRLTIFLGKPIYAFSVVLFTLLVCAGIGSLLSHRIARRSSRAAHMIFALLLSLLLFVAVLLPDMLAQGMGESESFRILLALVYLAPLGFLLGFPLPLMMARLNAQDQSLIPLAWAINGGSSVMASVLAMVISINWGLQATILAGFACYAAAWALFARGWRS